MMSRSIFGLVAAGLCALPALGDTFFTSSPPSAVTNPISSQAIYNSGGSNLFAATNYASQSIAKTADGGTITVPAGLAFTVFPAAPANSVSTDYVTSAESNGLLTITLPSGAQFASVPTVSVSSASSSSNITTSTTTTTSTLATNATSLELPIRLVGPGAISPAGNKMVFNLTAGKAKKNVVMVIQLGSFQISGATAMVANGATLQINAGISGFVTNAKTLNDSRVIEGIIANSVSGISATAAAGPGDTIAVTAKAIGTQFNSYDLATAAGATTGPAILGLVADLANVNITPSSALDSTATAAPYTASSTGTLRVAGLFSGYKAAWLASGSTCSSSTQPSDALAGTISTNAITFANVPAAGTIQAICVQADGTNVVSPTGPVTITFSIDTQTQTLASSNTISLGYGGSSFRVPLFRTADTNTQPRGYLRLVNTTTQDTPFFAIIRSDAGGIYRGQIATLKANQASLISDDAIIAALGAQSAFPANQVGSATIFSTAIALGQSIPGYSQGNGSGVTVTAIQLAPSGLISNIE
jgi:hypothetical protein